jgi:GntR family transcriptional regulator, arabinose operon transcriptional repressor
LPVDRNSNKPLYLQLKEHIIERIKSGEIKPGDFIQTEEELCCEYGLSRYPIRQALSELVEEGYLVRTRGKGTSVSSTVNTETFRKTKLLGLILGNLEGGLNGQILSGFEKQLKKSGYLTMVCSSQCNSDEELNCIDMLAEQGCAGIFVFSTDDSRLTEKIDKLGKKQIHIGLLDRNLGLNDIDYVGSDNRTGAYMAVRHIALQGFRNVVFIAHKSDASSITERMEGFMKGVEDLGLNLVNNISISEDITHYLYYRQRFFIERISEEITALKKYLPVGVLAVNDSIALQCMNVFDEREMMIGKDIGIIGFDNTKESEFSKIPLTTVAQNGILIGQTAADIAVEKIEGRVMQVTRSVIPTQLVVRNSCGEGLLR